LLKPKHTQSGSELHDLTRHCFFGCCVHAMAAGAALYGACELSGDLPDAMAEETYAGILQYLKKHRPDPKEDSKKEHSYLWAMWVWIVLSVKACIRKTCPCCFKRMHEFNDTLRSFGDEGEESGETYSSAQMMLRRDMAANKVLWYGDYSKDLWCFSRNINPVLALFYSHPLHTVTRGERIFITILQVVFILMISAAIPRTRLCIAGGFDCTAWIVYQTDETAFCCTVEQLGLTWSLENLYIAGISIGGSVYSTVANIIFAVTLYWAGASCACIQHLSPPKRRFGEFLGHVLLLVVLLVMILPTYRFLVASIRHAYLDDLIFTFFVNKPLTLSLTTLWQTFLFSVLWWHSNRAHDHEDRKYYVTVDDYWAYAKRRSFSMRSTMMLSDA